MPKYFVYMLSCRGGSLYTGIARDVQARFEEHRRGAGAKYTAAHRPIRIEYVEEKRSRGAALKREHEIKKLRRVEKLSLIADSPL
jgi:putative endonuclease